MVEPKGQAGAVLEREEEQEAVEEEVVVAAVVVVAVELVAALAAALGMRLDGSFTSQKEQSFSTRRGNWI